MKKVYKFNKEWLDDLLKNKDNMNARYVFSDNDIRILLTYIEILQNRIDKAIELLKEKIKVIPFDENGEGGGLELTDYDIQDLLDILKESGE